MLRPRAQDQAERPRPHRAEGRGAVDGGRYKAAIEAFDFALAINPKAPETLSARAIARLGLGDLAGANADWRRQLELLVPGQAAARACVALRLADYAAALPELEKAIARRTGRSLLAALSPDRAAAGSAGRRRRRAICLPARRCTPAEREFQKGVAAPPPTRPAAKAQFQRDDQDCGPASADRGLRRAQRIVPPVGRASDVLRHHLRPQRQPRLQPAQARGDQLQCAGRGDERSRRRDPVRRLQHAGRPSDLPRGDRRHADGEGQEGHAHLPRAARAACAPQEQDASGGARIAVAQRGAAPVQSEEPLDPLHQHRHVADLAQPKAIAERHPGRAARRLLPDPALRDSRDAVGGRLRPQGSGRQPGQAARLVGALPPQPGGPQFHADALRRARRLPGLPARGHVRDPRLRRGHDPGLALRFEPRGAPRALSRPGRHLDRQGLRLSLRSHAGWRRPTTRAARRR